MKCNQKLPREQGRAEPLQRARKEQTGAGRKRESARGNCLEREHKEASAHGGKNEATCVGIVARNVDVQSPVLSFTYYNFICGPAGHLPGGAQFLSSTTSVRGA